MTEKDDWPAPEYNVGQHDHVHAIGVISLLTAQFERSVDSEMDPGFGTRG